MEEVKQWLSNSIAIAKCAGESFEAKFTYEVEKREQLAKDFKKTQIEVTPELFSGTYRAIGQNPDDIASCYIGNVEIFYKNDTWKAKWNISGYTHEAYGMLVTPSILVFNYSYKNADNHTKSGIVAYTYLSTKIVKGSWLEEGFPIKGIEELRRLDADEDSNLDAHDANLGFSLN